VFVKPISARIFERTNKEQNVQVSDTTGDAMKYEIRLPNKLLLIMQRRKFLQSASLAAIATSLSPKALAVDNKKQFFRAAFLSDVHVKPTTIAEEGMRKAYHHANNNLNPKADFIINGGDAIMDALKATKEKHNCNGMCGIKCYRLKINYRCITALATTIYGVGK